MSQKSALALEPRLLSRELAARYCGVSVPTLESECPVTPVKIKTRVLYDRKALDRWLDTLSPEPPKSRPGSYYLARLDDVDADQGR